jgi:DNA polymerase-3 subunit gamma/tau
VATRSAASSRPRSTLNLREIATTLPKAVAQEVVTPPPSNKPLQEEEVKRVWAAYAESQRGQVAEYQLLNRDIRLTGSQIVLSLTNPFEEQLLQALKTDAVTFLRTQLENNQVTIESVLVVPESKKMIYTNREKFDFLLEKHPNLREWRDRLGLDAEF